MCDIISDLARFTFKAEFEYGECIQEAATSSSLCDSILLSRIEALGISVICVCALAVDIVYMAYHTLAALGYAIVHLDSPLKYVSQMRNVLVCIIELARHFLGIVAGSLVGIVSPELAKSLFLPADQSAIAHDFTPTNVAKTYKMLQVIHELFSQAGIDYSMVSGTQLGAKRHGGIFGWDDDGDLFVLKGHEKRLESLKEEFNKRGLLLKDCAPWGYKVCDASGALSEHADDHLGRYHYPFVDLMFARKENGRVSYDYDFWRNIGFPNEYFTEEEWDHREEWQFGPIRLTGVPADKAEEWCTRVYGTGALDTAYSRTFSHKTFGCALPQKVGLTKGANGKCPPAVFDVGVFATSYQRQDVVDPTVAALQKTYDDHRSA